MSTRKLRELSTCRLTKLLGLGIAAALLGALPASGQISERYDFDELPSLDPAINYCGPIPESQAFSLDGNGLLRMHSTADKHSRVYQFSPTCVNEQGAGIDPARPFDFEVKLRINSITGVRGGAYFHAYDGVNEYRVWFTQTGVSLVVPGPELFQEVELPIFEDHVYRISSPANSSQMRFYVDGELVTTVGVPGATMSRNMFQWGGGLLAAGAIADADWDYVQFSQPTALPSLGGPGLAAITLVLLAWGAAMAGRRLST